MNVEQLAFSITVIFRVLYSITLLLFIFSFYQIIKSTYKTRTRIEKIIYILYTTQVFHLIVYLLRVFVGDNSILLGPTSVAIFLFYPLMMILDIETWNVLAPLTTWVTPKRTLMAQIISFLISFGLLGGLSLRGFLYTSSLQDKHWAAVWVQKCLPFFYGAALGYMLTKQLYFAYKMKQWVEKSPEYQRVRTFHLSRKYHQCIRYQIYLAVLVIISFGCHFVNFVPRNGDLLRSVLKVEAEITYIFLSAPILYYSSIFAILLQGLKLDTVRRRKSLKIMEIQIESIAKSAISNRIESGSRNKVFSDKKVRFQLQDKSIVYPEFFVE